MKKKSKIKVTRAMALRGACELDYYTAGEDKLEYAKDIYIVMEKERREALNKKRRDKHKRPTK